ncbi:hypothetical protein Bca101_082514 [Brassica carinata]
MSSCPSSHLFALLSSPSYLCTPLFALSLSSTDRFHKNLISLSNDEFQRQILCLRDLTSKKPNGKDVVSSAEPDKSIGQTCVPSGKAVSGDCLSKKPHGKGIVLSDAPIKADEVLFFRDVKLGPHEGELRFRLIHYWEARNPHTKTIIGLEILLIDEQGTAIQGFIPPGRIDTYLPHMVAGSIYKLTNLFGSKSKVVYRVAEPTVTVAFSWNSVLSELKDSSVLIPEDRFRFYGHEEFEAACDLGGDLYDFVGHLKLVNGKTLSDRLVIDEVEITSTRRILLHVQTYDGPVMKLCLWDKAATDFCEKFRSQGNTPSVILVTTLNPKRIGGVERPNSLLPSPSRVFLDLEVQPTRDYLTWLSSNSAVANRVNADIVTKTETVTIGELLSYMKQEGSKVAWFECTATTDDVAHGAAWYYIACGGCKTKATKGPTKLWVRNVERMKYLARLSVYDNIDHANFVLLGDAGRELTGRQASELVESYFEANERVRDDHVVPVPQALIDTIGTTHKFIVKVSTHNLTGKTKSLTVTRVHPPEAPAPNGEIEENVNVPSTEEALQLGNLGDGPPIGTEESADERVKRSSDMTESEDAKRAKYFDFAG